jgi:hypothetical protein
MTDSPVGFFRDSGQVEFRSAFGLTESVQRLRAATRKSAFGVMAEQAAVGPVEETRVRLERVIPMFRNSFKPCFAGRFEQRGDGVYLIGRFAVPWAVRIFMGIWLGGVLVIGMPAALSQPGWPSLMPIGMFAFGVGMIALGLWLSRNDPQWLSGVIQGALGTRAPDSGSPVQQMAASTPLVLRLSALFFAVAGAGNIASGFVPMHDVPKGFFPWSTHPELPVVYGLCLLALAAGVYRRQMWAWHLGVVIFGVTGVLSIVGVAYDQAAPLPVKVLFGVAMLAVVLSWTRWWYAQRRHFVREADPFSG